MRLYTSALCLALSFAAVAQEAAETRWTLQQCIDYAVANNLSLRQKVVSIARSDANLEAGQAALWPSLSFATNQSVSWRPWSQQYVNISDGTFTSSTSEVNYNGTYSLQAQWTIWNGGRNRKQVELYRLQRDQAVSDAEGSALSLQQQIVQIYVQILYQTEAVEVNSQILESSRVQLDRAQQMYDVGTMSRADLAQMQAQVSQDEYNVTNAATQLEDFKLQLKQLLEIVGQQRFEVAVPEIDDDSILAPLPTVADVYSQSLAIRPEIRYNRLGIEAADLSINIAKRGYYPTVSLSAAVNSSNTSGGIDNNFGNQLKTNLNNSAGLTISVPIFDNKTNKTNVIKARLEREDAEIALAQEEKQLYSDIETFRLNATNAQRQYAAAVANTAAMQESYTLVSEQFAVGLKDIVDLTTGKNNLLQAEQQMLQSKYTAVLNRALLLFYQGHPLTLQ